MDSHLISYQKNDSAAVKKIPNSNNIIRHKSILSFKNLMRCVKKERLEIVNEESLLKLIPECIEIVLSCCLLHFSDTKIHKIY